MRSPRRGQDTVRERPWPIVTGPASSCGAPGVWQLTWYLPAVELYHPEAPSGSRDEPRSAQRYDAWLHDHRWGERIALVMEGHDLAGISKEG